MSQMEARPQFVFPKDWRPRAGPVRKKPLTEDDMACLNDDYYDYTDHDSDDESQSSSDDDDNELFDYETVVTLEELYRAEQTSKARLPDPDYPDEILAMMKPRNVTITVVEEDGEKKPRTITIELYNLITANRIIQIFGPVAAEIKRELKREKEEKEEAKRAEEEVAKRAEEDLKNLNIQDPLPTPSI